MKLCVECRTPFQSQDWQCPSCDFLPPKENGIPSLSPDVCETHTEFDRAAFQRLSHAEQTSFWFKARNDVIIWALKKYFPKAKSFLEIGCGTGYVLSGVSEQMPGIKVYGSDLSPDGLVFTAENVPEAELFQMDALRMPFDAEFDVVGVFDVLEHIDSDTQVLSQMFKSIRKGGGVIVSVPQHMFLWSNRDDLARHLRRYSTGELKQKMEQAGFRVADCVSFMTSLVPLMMAAKTLINYSSNERVAKDLTPSPLVSGILSTVLSCEHSLIKAGMRLPIGGSLLMVGVKD